jgi:type II secretory pathway component PulF
MRLDPFLSAILFIAALPTVAVSLRSARGWRASLVFAAFYPAFVVLVGIVLIAVFLVLAALGIVDLD